MDKALKATGGKDKIEKYKGLSMKMKGKISIMGMDIEFTAKGQAQMPDKTRTQFEGSLMGQKFTRTQVVNGDKGWVGMAGMVMDISEMELANAKEEMYSDWVSSLIPLSDPAYKLAPLGESKVGSQAVVGVKVSHKGHQDINLYFDKKDGLLAKVERCAKDPMGAEVDQAAIYSDYKERRRRQAIDES